MIIHVTNDAARSRIKTILLGIQPTKIIAPFGLEGVYKQNASGAKVICQPGKLADYRLGNIELKTNNSVHAKLWLNDTEAVYGSWNFSDSGFIEIAVHTNDPDEVRGFHEMFDAIWRRSP